MGERAAKVAGALLGHRGRVGKHRDVPLAHWYVMVVGVAPEAQGTGIGQALLRPMIDIVVVFSNGGFDWD